MKSTLFLPCIIGFCLTLSAFAADDAALKTVKKFSLEKLNQTYKKAASLEADFSQEVYQASLARTKTSTGSLRISKPASIRWEIYKPEASVMVSNGRKLWYYTPSTTAQGKGQVLVRSVAEIRAQPLFRVLTGASDLNKEFTLEKTETTADGAKQITLSPKNPKLLQELRLTVSDKYLISEIFLKNPNGNTTRISLQNQVLGAKLPPDLFNFKPPAGAEIIKNND